jgi:hypothetical protein
VLVSGGIDSTYLFEIIDGMFHDKCYPINNWNPYEVNKTVKQIGMHPRFMETRPTMIKGVMRESFLKIPHARKLRKKGKYHKHVFPCCAKFKQDNFKKDREFSGDGTVIVSGVKAADSRRRFFWMKDLREGNSFNRPAGKKKRAKDKKVNLLQYLREPNFYHLHAWGGLYCYPFRDYDEREFPDEILAELREKYPDLKHSGCSICPILVMFDLKFEKERYPRSIKYYNMLTGQKTLEDYVTGEGKVEEEPFELTSPCGYHDFTMKLKEPVRDVLVELLKPIGKLETSTFNGKKHYMFKGKKVYVTFLESSTIMKFNVFDMKDTNEIVEFMKAKVMESIRSISI